MRKDKKERVIDLLKSIREAFQHYLFFHNGAIIDGSYYVAEFRVPETIAEIQNFIATLEKGKPLTNDHFLLLHGFSSLARKYNIIAGELKTFVCDIDAPLDIPYTHIGKDEILVVESFRRNCEDARAKPKRNAYTNKQFRTALEMLKEKRTLKSICMEIAPKKPKGFEESLRHWYKKEFGKRLYSTKIQGK